MEARDYQDYAVSKLFEYFEEFTGNPLVAMPTGTGKSPVIGFFIKQALERWPRTRIMVATHTKELIVQDVKALRSVWPSAPVGIYSAGLNQYDKFYPITFAGIDSVVSVAAEFGYIDLLIVDEAHLVSPKDDTRYQKLILTLRKKNPNIKVIGLTATHFRKGQGLLTDDNGIFTDVAVDMTTLEAFNWFVDEGWLTNLIPHKTEEEYSTEGISIQHGEFNQGELQEAVDKAELTFRVCNETIRLGVDRHHWLIFSAGVNHAIHVKDMFLHLGVTATCVHSKMGVKERDYNIAAFKAGEFQAMVNNGILTTGFDFPALDLIGMYRPTNSPGLWVQMLGRGTRPFYASGIDLSTKWGRLLAIQQSQKKNCLVLDFAGNTKKLGPINDPVIPKKKGAGGSRPAPIRICEACGTYNHAAARFCINCGSEFVRQIAIQEQASTAELVRKTEDKVPIRFEEFDVSRVTYNLHYPKRSIISQKPPSLRVSYYCGTFNKFDDYLCLEHIGFAQVKARKIWRDRTKLPEAEIPSTIEEAVARIDELKVPRRIKVLVKNGPGEHSEVVSYEY